MKKNNEKKIKRVLDEKKDEDDYIISIDKSGVHKVQKKDFYKNTINELSNIYDTLDDDKIIRRDQSAAIESVDEAAIRLGLDSDAIHAYTDDVENNIFLKKKYANKFIWIFILQLISFNGIFIATGLHVLSFDPNTLNIFVAGGFIEVVALMKIIIQGLFEQDFNKSLKDILEKNKKDK